MAGSRCEGAAETCRRPSPPTAAGFAASDLAAAADPAPTCRHMTNARQSTNQAVFQHEGQRYTVEPLASAADAALALDVLTGE